MLQGEMTYHQQGKPDVVVRPSGGFAEGRATTHWGENTGKVPAVSRLPSISGNRNPR